VTAESAATGALATPGARRASGRWTVFAVVSVGLLMSSIDQTIVATALPAIRDDLHASINWASWTITIYSLGRVLILPLAGRLGDKYGRRTIFLGAIVVFTASSLACGLANDVYLLVALRAVQAIGGAAFMPSATGLVVDHFGSGRDRAVGLFSSIVPIGAIIGPILGGVFVSYWSWRGIFLVNVPIGVGLLLAGRRYIPRDTAKETRKDPLDVRGMLYLGIGMLSTMLGIALFGGSTNRATIGVIFAGALLFISLFLWHVRHTANPFISPRLLTGHGFGTLNLINLLFGATALGFSALVPLYAIDRYRISALDSGTLLTYRALGMIALAGLTALALRHTGYRWPMFIGSLLTAVGLLALATHPLGMHPYAWLSLTAGLTGIGMGLVNPAAQNASLQLAPDQAAAIAGLRGTFRQAGSITAISITTAIMASSSNPGIAQGRIFAVFAVILLASLPLIALIPEHRGSW
jgi:EmrB/QacA subfamily drug resistance transporter